MKHPGPVSRLTRPGVAAWTAGFVPEPAPVRLGSCHGNSSQCPDGRADLGRERSPDPLVHTFHVHPLSELRDPERPAEDPLPALFQPLGREVRGNGARGRSIAWLSMRRVL